jgi:hypothetical protein
VLWIVLAVDLLAVVAGLAALVLTGRMVWRRAVSAGRALGEVQSDLAELQHHVTVLLAAQPATADELTPVPGGGFGIGYEAGYRAGVRDQRRAAAALRSA